MNPLILVNAQHACPEGLPDLVPVGGSPVLLDRQAAQALEALMGPLDGWRSIVPVSGWRSFLQHEAIYAGSLAVNGLVFTQKYVAFPGHSEHQTGLAIDLGLRGPELDFIRPAFPNTGICQRFRERAAGFGFVERYPAGKEPITGIAHEPWHFRYVGPSHARAMVRQGLTLEEYLT